MFLLLLLLFEEETIHVWKKRGNKLKKLREGGRRYSRMSRVGERTLKVKSDRSRDEGTQATTRLLDGNEFGAGVDDGAGKGFDEGIEVGPVDGFFFQQFLDDGVQ